MISGFTSLPQEIVNLISVYLLPEGYGLSQEALLAMKRPSYATISRSWQYAIESRTFRKVTLKSPDIQYFSRIMNDTRRAMLRELKLVIVLPSYTDKACAEFETEAEEEANNRVFSEALKSLFALLRAWDDTHRRGTHEDSPHSETSLILWIGDCYSPTDGHHRDSAKYQDDYRDYMRGKRHDLFEHRYESSVLRLQESDGIENVSRVSQLWVLNDKPRAHNRKMEPRSIALIASKLPHLEEIDFKLDNNEREPYQRQQRRYDFASALRLVNTQSLKNISLDLSNDAPMDELREPPSALLPSSPNTDHLSLALHALSQSKDLTALRLGDPIVISKCLFWPEASNEVPIWSNLQHLDITFSMATADGEWYFVREEDAVLFEVDDPGDLDENPENFNDAGVRIDATSDLAASYDLDLPDSYDGTKVLRMHGTLPRNEFRTKPVTSKFHPLFADAARAAAHMPQLKRMSMKTFVREPRTWFGFTYYAPEEQDGHDYRYWPGSAPRLDWYVLGNQYECEELGFRYVPEESTVDIWRRVARAHGELEVRNLRKYAGATTCYLRSTNGQMTEACQPFCHGHGACWDGSLAHLY